MVDNKDFIAIFKAETEDHLTKLDKGIVELEKEPKNPELIKELNREAHTIKGSARVFGYSEIQEIAHKIEDIFENMAQKKLVFESAVANKIFEGLDVIRTIVKKIGKKDSLLNIDVSEVCKGLEDVMFKNGKKKKPAEDKDDNKQKTEESPVPEEEITREVTGERVGVEDSPPEVKIEEYIRVPVSRINKILNLMGEMVINKMKSSRKIIQAKRLTKLAKQLQKTISELAEITGSPLEDEKVRKQFSKCNAEAQRIREESTKLYENISMEATHLDPVIEELQDNTKKIKMVPCSTILEGFPRMVRDIASQEGKEVNLEIYGAETELDKKVLEGIKTPLMHILRNCIDHGIEEPETREALGKPRYGTIKLRAFHEAGDVIIEIEDDGAGIDIEETKQIAIDKRLISTKNLGNMTDKEIKNIVFMNGYSTSKIITDVSGRGIGLDIVRCDTEKLKGKVVLDTEPGKGTKFTLILPLTIAVIQGLLVKSQNNLFAIPMASVERIIDINLKDISSIEGKMAIQVQNHIIPLIQLDDVLELPPAELKDEEPEKNEDFPVVLASSLDKHVGFIVDEVVSEEEIFIKSLNQHLGRLKNIGGVTILGTGEVVVILEIADLIVKSRSSHPAVAGKKPILKEKRKGKKVLIAEDALSARELEKSILEAQGYTVDTAVDGLDALEKLAKAKFDLIVTDVQMPRMDGFELCRALKKNDKHKNIPIVMVTALDKEEDKRHGIEVGAAAYIIKSAFNQRNLLDTIERLID